MGQRGFYKDLESGRRIRVTSGLAEQFRQEAILYYRPLPMRKVDTKDIFDFIRSLFTSRELLMLLAATIATLLLGMVTPVMTKVLTSQVKQFGDMRLLTVILVILLLVTAAGFLVTAMKQLLLARISSKVAIPLQCRPEEIPASRRRRLDTSFLSVPQTSTLCPAAGNNAPDTTPLSVQGLKYMVWIC